MADKTPPAEIFAWRLKIAMRSRGIDPMRMLCRESGIERTSLYYHMHNETLPSTEQVLQLARYLRVSVDWLLGLSPDMVGKIKWKG